MNQTATPSSSGSTRLFQVGWTTILSLVAAITAAGAGTLHIVGLTRHRVYLNYWGINPNLFPKTTDWLLLNGYYGLIDRVVVVINALLEKIVLFALATMLLGAVAFVLDAISRREPMTPPKRFLPQAAWLRRLIALLFAAGLVTAFIPGALVLLTAFSAVPAALGEIAGASIAEAELNDYQNGCAKSKHQCVQLKRGAENIAKGYVLDDTQSHIAIFDVDLQRGRTLPREGLEVVAVREPGFITNGK